MASLILNLLSQKNERYSKIKQLVDYAALLRRADAESCSILWRFTSHPLQLSETASFCDLAHDHILLADVDLHEAVAVGAHFQVTPAQTPCFLCEPLNTGGRIGHAFDRAFFRQENATATKF